MSYTTERKDFLKKKSLGQNFLRDEDAVKKIISAVSAHLGEVIVEVGPGEGVLTERLAASGATVVAIELDDRLVPILKEKFKNFPNVHVVHEDILQVNMERVFERCALQVSHYKLVGNLPYYITSAIIRKFLEIEYPPTEMLYMMQKEVAERICAKPGKMSVLAVAVQYYAEPEWLFVVPKESFEPVPKVESAFIRIKREKGEEKREENEEIKKFFRVVKTGFSARRKMLANNLANGLHVEKGGVEKILVESGVSEKARAQDLSVEDWKVLTKMLK